MVLLINRSQIQTHKQISNSVHNDKLEQIIGEAQFNDLLPLLGERLYYDILTKVEAQSTGYDTLLDGNAYEYNGITYTNVGLRAVLARYIYARYAMFGDVIDNPFGMTTKLNVNESKPIDYSTKKAFFTMNNNEAFNMWLNVEKYLTRTGQELFHGCLRKKNTFNIRKIG